MFKITFTALFLLIFSSTALADCTYSADARGSSDDGVLCDFGEEEAKPEPVGPQRGRRRHQEGILTPQEERGVIRSLTTRYRGGSGLLNSAVNGGTRPYTYQGRVIGNNVR